MKKFFGLFTAVLLLFVFTSNASAVVQLPPGVTAPVVNKIDGINKPTLHKVSDETVAFVRASGAIDARDSVGEFDVGQPKWQTVVFLLALPIMLLTLAEIHKLRRRLQDIHLPPFLNGEVPRSSGTN